MTNVNVEARKNGAPVLTESEKTTDITCPEGQQTHTADQNVRNVPLLTSVRANARISQLRSEFTRKIQSYDIHQAVAPDSPVKENRTKSLKLTTSDDEFGLGELFGASKDNPVRSLSFSTDSEYSDKEEEMDGLRKDGKSFFTPEMEKKPSPGAPAFSFEDRMINAKAVQAYTLNDQIWNFPKNFSECSFDKKENPFVDLIHLNIHQIYCPNCDDVGEFTKDGMTNNSIGIKCKSCKKKRTVLQAIKDLPHETISQLMHMTKLTDRADFLKWLDIGQKASHQTNSDLSATQSISTPQPVSNIEKILQEVLALKADLRVAVERQIQAEERLLQEMSLRKAAEEEIAVLKARLAEPRTAPSKSVKQPASKEPVKTFKDADVENIENFADAAARFTPVKSRKQRTPISKAFDTPDQILEIIEGKSPNTGSELTIAFIEGCKRGAINDYRRVLQHSGFDHYLARDISFLTDNIMQVITYSDKVESLVDALKKNKPDVRVLEGFDPMSPDSYDFENTYTRAEIEKGYMENISRIHKRLSELSGNVPSMKRTVLFLKKVLETANIHYKKPAPRKFTFMTDFLPRHSPTRLELVDL